MIFVFDETFDYTSVMNFTKEECMEIQKREPNNVQCFPISNLENLLNDQTIFSADSTYRVF